MPKKFIRRIYHACWYVFAFAVLSTALVITVFRIMLPHAGAYREELQNIISRQTGYSIEFEKITGAWEGWVPTVHFTGINISTHAKDQEFTRLTSATLKFNPYLSLKQGSIMPFRVTITGLDLTIVRDANGSLSIATGATETTTTGTGINNATFTDWLFLQKSISISNASIRIMDASNDYVPVLLTDVNLDMTNSATRMQASGSMVLPATYGEKCFFALDLHGNITTPNWSGQIYIDALRIQPGAWLSHLNADSPLLPGNTLTSVRIWSVWEKARLTRINGAFQASDIKMELAAATLDVQHVDALFSLARDQGNDLRARIRIKELRTGNEVWPVMETVFIRQSHTSGEGFLYISHTDNISLVNLVSITAGHITGLLNSPLLKDLSTSGLLQDCLIIYDPERAPSERIAIDTRVVGLTVTNARNQRIYNLVGRLSGYSSRGVFSLDTPSAEIALPGILANAITLNELQGDVYWYNNGGSLRIESAYLQTHTPHFYATLQGNIEYSPGMDLPFADLYFSASDLGLENIHFYLPAMLSINKHEWIKQALVAGDVSSLDLILRGNLAEFPFDHNEGRMEAIAEIHKGTLDYHASWVPVDNLEAELRIDGRTMTVDANSGNIYNAVITNTQGIIANLGAQNNSVEVKGNVKGKIEQLLTFIKNTPLSSSPMLGKVSQQDFDGNFTLDLGLMVPLYDMPVSYNGTLKFDSATLGSPAYGINLEQLAGNVVFSDAGIATENLTANYSGEPVTINIKHSGQDGLHIGLEGNSSSNFIAATITRFLKAPENSIKQISSWLDGATHWQATLSPVNDASRQGKSNDMLLRISSTLAGLAINLPEPIGKTYDTRPLEITTVITANPGKHVDITYGDDFTGSIDLKQDLSGMHLARAELALGADTQKSTVPAGIIIHGTVDKLFLSEWYNFFHAPGNIIGGALAGDVQIDIMANMLGVAVQHYENTHIKLLREDPDWHITLNGNEIAGDIYVSVNSTQAPVRGLFSRLRINRNDENRTRTHLDPGTLPPLQFQVDEFIYGDFSLGKLDLTTTPDTGGLSVTRLLCAKPELEISGIGTWTLINDVEKSDFDLVLRSTSLATMLSTFNYSNEPVKDGSSRFILNAQWPGSPMDFSLGALGGELKVQIEKGKFLNIEPKAGRLFGLLNIQSLIRLVSLDLSVLFSKGYAFDKIEGVFTLEAGNAYTNNLTIKGPSADMNLSGRTGLLAKDYDQVAIVSPKALFGPIGMGLGAVIFLAGEVFQSIPEMIDELFRYQYTIKGSWEEPVITKITGEE